jgi:hypothetical protein
MIVNGIIIIIILKGKNTHTHTRDREQQKDDTNVNTHATVAVSFGNCTKALAGTAAAGRQAGRQINGPQN